MCKEYKLSREEKRHYDIYLSYITHYLILILQPHQFTTQNPLPYSCSATLYALCFLNPLFLKAWFARSGISHPSLFARGFKGILERKFKEDMSYAGESKVSPHLFQRGFEGIGGFLQNDSLIEVKQDPGNVNMGFIGFKGFSTSDNITGQTMSIVLSCQKRGFKERCDMNMNNDIKIIASDYDHTLTNEDRNLPKELTEVLKGFIDDGGIMLVVSGRATNSLYKATCKLPFPVWLSSANGSLLKKRDGGPTLIDEYLPIDIIPDCIRLTEGLGYPHIFFDDRAYSVLESPETKMYADALSIEIGQIEDIYSCIEEGIRTLIFRCDEDMTPRVFKILRERLDGYAHVTTSHAKLVDVIPIKAGKGKALHKLLSHLGIDRVNCLAMGDSLNDLDLLQASGIKATVANGIDELKEIADYISPYPKGEGALDIVKRYLNHR